jgi:hypothetical protein
LVDVTNIVGNGSWNEYKSGVKFIHVEGFLDVHINKPTGGQAILTLLMDSNVNNEIKIFLHLTVGQQLYLLYIVKLASSSKKSYLIFTLLPA